jgi:hypothetical protein
MQGDAYSIPVTIKSGNGTLITPEIAACVEITVGQFTKRWPGQVTFDEKTGEWQFPVTQKQTFRFTPGAAVVQARVVFQDGSIMGGSGAPVRVVQSASHGTLPQPEKTEAVTGSAPKATEVMIPTVHDIDVSLHSQVILSDPIKAPYIGDNGNWYEYDAATGTFIDTGTPASGTPPITPDTAGKYLTNDGSKAEWGEVKESVEVGDAKDGNLLKLSGSDVLNAATPNVDYALPTLYVTITQEGEDGSGHPIYKSDKTYAEIKAAHEAGRDVKIARAGAFKDEILFTLGINDFPLDFVDADEADFTAVGVPAIPFVPSAVVGGQILSVMSTFIYKDGRVQVNFPFDIFDGEVTWNETQCYKLPQQYVITVTAGADGTLTADWTFEEVRKTISAYQTDGGGTVVFGAFFDDDRLYRMVAGDDKSVVFTDTTPEGISTLTLSQKDGKDVWTHEVVPLGGDNSFKVTLTSKVSGGYDIDKTFNEIVKAYNDNKYVYALFQNKNDFEFLSLDEILIPGVEGYGLIAFSGEHRYIAFRSSGGSALMYDKSRSSDNGVRREAMPPVPVTAADNGKFLRVVDGQWAADSVANAKGVSF